MKKLLLCVLLCVAFAKSFYGYKNLFVIVSDDSLEKDKIVGGSFIQLENVPYQASIFVTKSPRNKINICGGSIIDHYWILTASHCVEKYTNLSVRTGGGYRSIDSGTEHQIAAIIMHPNYNTLNLDNDVALIKLTKPIEFNERQKSIDIASPNDLPQENQKVLISGFGKEGYDLDFAPALKATYVPVMNQEKCEKAYRIVGDPITDNMFCAGDGSEDACKGDSGGPAVINNKLYGVISSGRGCARKLFPGVYTRLHKYYDWIVNTVRMYS